MTELGLLSLALIPLALVELAKAARWRALFGAAAPPYLHFLQALVAAQATNALAPVRAGEILGIGVLVARRGAAVPATASLAGTKVLDAIGLAIIASLVVGVAVVGTSAWTLVGAGVVAIAGVSLMFRGSPIRTWLERYPIARRLRLAALVDIAASLRSPSVAGTVALTTAVVWAAGLAANAVVLAAVGAPVTLDLAARVLVAGYLVGLAPAPPARLGVFEAGVAGALLSGGVAPVTAVAAAAALHACQLANLGLLFGASVVGRRWLLSP